MTKKQIIEKLITAGIEHKSTMKLEELKALLPAEETSPVGSELALGIVNTIIGIQQTANLMFMRKGDLLVKFSELTGATTYPSLLKAYREALKPYAVHYETSAKGIERFQLQIPVSADITVKKPYGTANDVCHTLAVSTVKTLQTRSAKFDKKTGKATVTVLKKITKGEEVTAVREVHQKTVFKPVAIDFALSFLDSFKK